MIDLACKGDPDSRDLAKLEAWLLLFEDIPSKVRERALSICGFWGKEAYAHYAQAAAHGTREFVTLMEQTGVEGEGLDMMKTLSDASLKVVENAKAEALKAGEEWEEQVNAMDIAAIVACLDKDVAESTTPT